MSDRIFTPSARIAVVIPSYRVKRHILKVIEAIGPEVWRIYVVDDSCPDGSGDYVEQSCSDTRVRIVRNRINLGVGGAVLAGYRAAIGDGSDVVVKIDGDGQMDPALIPKFVAPILRREADYTKGNRFFYLDGLRGMPMSRLLGNAALSFLTKLSSGYWNIFDPTNGYTAIHASIAERIPFDKVSARYFFETDMLFRLNLVRAVVFDVPMKAKYADEVSGLRIHKIVGEFLLKHIINFVKRIFYNYFIREFSLASIELLVGIFLLVFGLIFGAVSWADSAHAGVEASAGTVMLAAVPLLMAVQFLLGFVGYDIASVPRNVMQDGERLSNFDQVGLSDESSH